MKKISNEDKAKILNLYVKNIDINNIAKELKLSWHTVNKTINEYKDSEEFKTICDNQKKSFVEQASTIIDDTLNLLSKRISTALKQEDEFKAILDTIADAELTVADKKKLIGKISEFNVSKAVELATVLGVLYDKRALQQGERTQSIHIQLDDELKDWAE
jgi:hypothetical protein